MTDHIRGWTRVMLCRRQVLKLAREMESRRNMVGTMIAKGRIPDIRTYTKGIINLREALMIRSTSCPWA